ncbi:M14 family zinc carboxypeptidase [candidate division KSB1 bacterium]
MRNRFIISLLLIVCFLTACSVQKPSGSIPEPSEFFGFEIGADKQLAHPDDMVAYFKLLADNSDRILFKEVGKTTEDNPFVMAIISSEENIKNIEHFKEVNAQLADPRMINDKQADELIRDGKTIVGINAGIHATEVGPVQASNIVAYKLATGNTPEIRNILDNVILVLTPMHNPDGAHMVVDWWRKYVNTEYEGAPLPYLYQKYTGHDNNRDWYFFTQKETRLTIKHLYGEWHPQIVVDMHQMGSTGARLFVPPFVDPWEPNIDPILQANVNMLGTFMLNRLTAQGFRGVNSTERYDSWTPGRAFQHYHGAVRILTETASVNIAGPVNVRPETLDQGGKLDRSLFFPLPWEGGRWGLDDIVEINVAAVFSVLENAALTRNVWLKNFYEVGKNAVSEKGDKPFAIVIPADQKDHFTTKWLIDVLQTGMVEVHKATADFSINGAEYTSGSAIIYMNQPYYSFAKTLLERQIYPELREFPGGPLKRPYDKVAHTLPLMMDVEVAFISEEFEVETALMNEAEVIPPAITEGNGQNGFIMSHANNGIFIAMNRLLSEDFPVYWTTGSFVDGDKEWPEGTVMVLDKGGQAARIKEIAAELNIDLFERQSGNSIRGMQINPVKVGHYQSWSGNMSEGWSRWVLETFDFEFESVHNDVIRAGSLNEKFNVITLADFDERSIIDGRTENTPPEYQGGIGSDGVNNLKQFVRNGGTLISWGVSNDFVMNSFDLSITNKLTSMSRQQRSRLAIPGSILKTVNNINHPVAYGLDENNIVYFILNDATILNARQGNIVSRYPNTEDLLLSGWLEGAEHLKGTPNVVEVSYGNGKIVLIGFDPIYRAQAQTTFKYLFNAMFYGTSEPVTIPASGN